MEIKNVVVPWSGGLDSTYMVLDHLRKGYRVYAPYITLVNNVDKVKNEKKAIAKMLKHKCFRHYVETGMLVQRLGISFDIPLSNGNILLKQPLFWLTACFYFLPNGVKIDYVNIAYVMNDCAISYLDEIKTIWNSFNGLSHQNLPALIFGLAKTPKSEIVESYSAIGCQDVLNMVWSCESPNGDLPCLCCPPCKRAIELGLIKTVDVVKTTIKRKSKNKLAQ